MTSRINLLSRWKQQSNNNQLANELVYKIYLLQEESIRRLYQQRLTENLSEHPRALTIDEEWEQIKIAIKKTANEAIGTKRKYRRKKGLRIWNEEIKNAIENKRTAYRKYLQNSSEENYETYKITRNMAKAIVSETHEESWDGFICRIESDIFGEQNMAYRVLKHRSQTNKDTIAINNIEDKKWIQHYKNMWCTNSPENNNDGPDTTSTPLAEIDEISDEELEQSMKSMKNRKAAGPDGLNSELFKYGGPVLSNRLLQLINKCWRERSIPEEWGQARVKSLFKKSKRDSCSNCRAISLLNSVYKKYAKIITQRFKTITEALLLEEQNGLDSE